MASKALGGKWLSSKVKEAKIAELRSSGYIPENVACHAPTPGQVIPTPNPGERMVFVPHFVRGLGFPLHLFLRGLLFFYGLDFHDLAPTPFSTSPPSFFFAKPSSGFNHTSYCGFSSLA
jgi:hypothetical protein